MLKANPISPGKKILFSPSYFYRKDIKQWRDRRPYPPYGTLAAAAYMRQNGFEVTLFDSHLRQDPEEIRSNLAAAKPGYLVIWDDGFNYLTKMCLTNMRDAAFELIALGAQAGCKIIVCNSDAMDHAGLYLSKGADFVIIGEGEQTLLDLVQSLEAGKGDPSQIQGLAFERNEKIIKTMPRPVLRDLDSLPDPAWDLVDPEPYRRIWNSSRGYFSLNIATTRGCPFKCNWCAKPIYGNRYNSRSPQRVVNEMKYLEETFEVDHIWMADDIFGLNPKWVNQFREEVKKQNLHTRYKIQSRADLLLQEQYLEALVESGVDEVWIGAESGAQKILDAMDKGTTVEQIRQATRLLHAKGVRVGLFLQFGYPGEGIPEIKATLKLLLELMPDDLGLSVSYPLPGTVFYERVKDQLRNKKNWTDSDDLAMMYQGAFSPAFYRLLHRYVHKLFRLKQGWQNLRALFKAGEQPRGNQVRSMLAIPYYLVAMIPDRIRLRTLS